MINYSNISNYLQIVADNFDKYNGVANKSECFEAFDRIISTLTNHLLEEDVQKIVNDIEKIIEEAFIAGQEEVLD